MTRLVARLKVVHVIAVSLVACSRTPAPPPQGTVTTTDAEEAPAESEAELPRPDPQARALYLSGGSQCLLTASAGVVSASCEHMTNLRCELIARAEFLLEYPGEETLARCEEGDEIVLALANADALIWSLSFNECLFDQQVSTEIVDVLPGAPRELLVRLRDCRSTGASWADVDRIFAARGARLVQVARADFYCSFRGWVGDYDVPHPADPPDGQKYECGGDYFDVRLGTVVRSSTQPFLTGTSRHGVERGSDHRIVRPTITFTELAFDEQAFRFHEPR